jgi:polyisoprenoid-binding protein YceI
MKRAFAFLAFPLLFVTAALAGEPSKTAPAVALNVRRGDSTVGFTIRKWGVMREQGRFREFSGSIFYDRSRPAASRVTLTVEAASVDTGVSARDETLRSEDFFDIARYPRWTFVSSSVRPTGADSAEVTGDMTIRGIKRRITVPVRFLGLNDSEEEGVLAGFETSFTLDRTDFGVLGSRWAGGRALLSREVNVHLFLGASERPDPQNKNSAARDSRQRRTEMFS